MYVNAVEPGQHFGEYVLGRRLGAGGQGEVFEAHDAIGMIWALKIGHPINTDDPSAIARFTREAHWVNHTLGALPRNSGIVVGDHYGVHDRRFYVKMRLIDGGSLAQRLNRGGALPLAEALTIARKLAQIVAVAHKHNAIHRDLKPENVLLDSQGCVHVVDWGCIHLVEAGQFAQSGAGPLCTLGYAAPEQYELKTTATAATDIYALGVMLLEMLTGYNCFLDSWRNQNDAPTEARDANATRTAAPAQGRVGLNGALAPLTTGLYPTVDAQSAREAPPDAVTRSTAATVALALEDRLPDGPRLAATNRIHSSNGALSPIPQRVSSLGN